jgi:hypothetical protein
MGPPGIVDDWAECGQEPPVGLGSQTSRNQSFGAVLFDLRHIAGNNDERPKQEASRDQSLDVTGNRSTAGNEDGTFHLQIGHGESLEQRADF